MKILAKNVAQVTICLNGIIGFVDPKSEQNFQMRGPFVDKYI